jgi:surface antigen
MKHRVLVLLAIVGIMFAYTPLWGQEYGSVLDAAEQQAMSETFQYVLENNRTNEASAWVNPDTERSGSVVPVRTYQNSAGQYCREFITTITIGGAEEPAYGTACRQPDGSWLIVATEPVAEQQQIVERVVATRYVYPYGYRYWYTHNPFYFYPDPWFYPSRIFFSFNIVHFSRTPHFKHSRVYHPHFHSVHRVKGVKGFHGRSHDGVIRSPRGGVVRPDDRQFRRDDRRRSDDRVLRGSSGSRRPHRFHNRPETFRPADRRAVHPANPSRDFQNRRDLRRDGQDRVLRGSGATSSNPRVEGRSGRPGGSDRRGIHSGHRPGRDPMIRPDVRDGRREMRGGRGDDRNRSDFDRGRSYRSGQRSTGDRSSGGERRGR